MLESIKKKKKSAPWKLILFARHGYAILVHSSKSNRRKPYLIYQTALTEFSAPLNTGIIFVFFIVYQLAYQNGIIFIQLFPAVSIEESR
jgi:hypothetical protein